MAIERTLEDPGKDSGPQLIEGGLAMQATLRPADSPRAPAPVEPGMQLGRYVVLDRLGAGGMGEVFTAWDPKLDRKLALKLLTQRSGGPDTSGRARLLREAQAMAKLEHPNVVTIHDVGTFGDELLGEALVFIAMEYIEGLTLRAWLRERARDWREILAVFQAAGEGLRAAHAVGLIHRDFKPDNVMVGVDGRVRVLDFGLARRGDDTAERAAASPVSLEAAQLGLSSSSGDSLGSLTRTGVLVGTPAYMSPEQFTGASLDARSDQFSFCVALHEALAGERPFAGEDQLELVRAIFAGELRPLARTDLPPRLVAALERGLAHEPHARWPDMASLLAALEPPAPRSQPRALLLALLAAVCALLAWAAYLGTRPQPEAAARVDCSRAGADIREAWNGELAARITANLDRSGLSWAPRTAARVEAELDEWAARWREESELACGAYHHRHELSAELFDLRMACLDQRRAALTSLAQLLASSEPSPGLVEAAAAAAAGLDDPRGCRSPELRALSSDDPELAAQIRAIEAELDRVEQLQDLGQFGPSLAAAEPLDARIEASGREELRARQLGLRALNYLHLGQGELALDNAIQAVAAGRRSGLDAPTSRAVLVLTRATLGAASLDESARWLSLGEALSEQLDDPWFHYEVLKARGFLARAREQYVPAAEHFGEALEFATAQFGPESLERSWELVNYGRAQVEAYADDPQRRDEGFEAWAAGAALSEELLGPAHPFTVLARFSCAKALVEHGRSAQAIAELERLAEVTAQLGPESPLHGKLAELRARAAASSSP